MNFAGVAVAGLIAATAGVSVSAVLQDKPDWGRPDEFSSDYVESKAICHKLGTPVVPLADRPTPAQMLKLKGCSSEKLYYGEGVKPDYVKARHCAFVETQGEDDQPFAGSTILMQLYANGLGVRRNPDLATAFACHIWSAPAEYDLRITLLQGLKQKSEHIDYCDSLTSGAAAGACAALGSRIAAVNREAGLTKLVAALSPAGRQLYPAMRTAFDAFAESSAGNEVDLSGTMRGVYVTDARDALNNQFVTDMGRLRTGKWPPAAASDAVKADAKLNATYRAMLAWADDKNNLTTIKSPDVRNTQRLWLSYRDAFARFAAVAAPSVGRDAIVTRLTRLRLAQLDGMRSGGETE